MTVDLGTTNVLLGLIAFAAVMEMAALIAACVGIMIVGRRLTALARSIDEQQIAPAGKRLHAILDDVKDVTATIRLGTGIVDKFVSRFSHR